MPCAGPHAEMPDREEVIVIRDILKTNAFRAERPRVVPSEVRQVCMDVSSKIDLKQLRYFVAVVDAGSISRASQMHHIAQPALSRRIAQLEQDLGVALLHRGYAGAQPTEQGTILYRAAQRILRDMSTAAAAVQAAEANPAGHVRVGCLQSLVTLVGAPLTIAMLAEHPQIRLAVITGQSQDIYRALLDGSLDIALFVWNEQVPHLEVELLLQEEFFLASAPDMPGIPSEDVVDLHHLAQVPFVFPTVRAYASGPLIIERLHGMGISLNVVAEVDGDGMRPLIRGGHAAAIATWSHVQEDVAAGHIVLKRLRNTPMARTLALCTAEDRPLSLAARAVAEQIKGLTHRRIQSGQWQHVHVKV